MAHSREEAAAKIAAREKQQNLAAGAGADVHSDEYQAAELARQEQKFAQERERVRRIEYEGYLFQVNALNDNPDYKGDKITPQTFEQWSGDADAADAAEALPEPPERVRPTKPRRTLSEAVQETLEEAPEVDDPRVQGGSVLIRWGLFPDPENPSDPEAYTLGLAIHEEGEAEPDSVFLDITSRMQHAWRKNNGEKVLERFAAGLIEKVIEKTSEDLGDDLIYALHRITDGDLRKGKVRLVDDPLDPLPGDEPENAGEVPEG